MADPQQSTIPPPPTSSPDLSGSGSGSNQDRFMGLISRLSGGGIGAIEQRLQEHHAKRATEASLAQQQLQSVANEYARAKTDEERAAAASKWEVAKERYTKIAGQSKEAKPIIQQTIGLIENLLGHGKGKQGQPQGAGGAGAQGAPSGPGPNARESTVPPPPSAGVSAAPVKSTLPPPPDPEMEAMGAPVREKMAQDDEAARTKDVEYRNKLKADADPQYRVNEIKQYRDNLKSAFPDMASEDIQKAVLTKAGVVPKGSGKEMQPDFKDGMLVGVKDPASNEYYTDPAKMPPEAKAIYDSAKRVEKEHEKAQEAKETRQLQRSLTIQTEALQKALERNDYVAAKKEVRKAKSNYEDAVDRMNTMDKNIIAAGKGDQQAMLSLVANHIGMTSGAQPKMRMSKAQWDEAIQSAPILARAKAKFDKDGYLQGVVLTPEQMKSMVSLAHEKVDILKEHVGRVGDDYSSDLTEKRSTVPKPPSSKSSGKIKVTAEDMANAGR